MLNGVQTQRLDFRLLQETDFDDWLPFFYQKDILHFLALDTRMAPHELCRLWLDKAFARYAEDRGGLNVLIDRETGAFIGQCGLLVQTINETEYLEIGYSILPQFWGKGYASEAAIKCRKMAFENGYATQLISLVHQDNVASAKVALKNGMQIIQHIPLYHGMPFNMFGVSKP